MSKIDKFKEQMQIELDANSHKGNWEDFVSSPEIHKELSHHIFKLQKAEEANNKKDIKEHIADCANILMMLGNGYGLYD